MYVLSVEESMCLLDTLIHIITINMLVRVLVSVIVWISAVITIHHVNTLRIIHG